MKIVALSLLALSLLPNAFAEYNPSHPAPPTLGSGAFVPAPKGASVEFLEPKDGATVPKEFDVKFAVKGMMVHPAGVLINKTGHHHLIVDGKPGAPGEVVPADDTHLHFGKGQSETKLKLAPGKHTLTLNFADGSHRSYGPEMAKTITVTVK
jgi:hypothetical protein